MQTQVGAAKNVRGKVQAKSGILTKGRLGLLRLSSALMSPGSAGGLSQRHIVPPRICSLLPVQSQPPATRRKPESARTARLMAHLPLLAQLLHSS